MIVNLNISKVSDTRTATSATKSEKPFICVYKPKNYLEPNSS